MVQLSPTRPGGPSGPDRRPLVTRLAASPRPALRQESPTPIPEPAQGTVDGGTHGQVDERIELSGAVTVNWAAKAAGLLHDEGVGPGDTVAVDLPRHWLSHALVLGVLLAGAHPVFEDHVEGAAAVLTDRPERWGDPATAVLAVALPRTLAPADGGPWTSDPSVVDVATEIRIQPDTPPGPVDHVHADALGPAPTEPAPSPLGRQDAPQARARLSRADAAAALSTWDAGGVVTVPA